MKTYNTECMGRGSRMSRLLRMMIALSQRSYSAIELTQKFRMSRKTILRDLQFIENAGIPLIEDATMVDVSADDDRSYRWVPVYKIESGFLSRFM